MIAEFESILGAAQTGADWAWRRIYDDLGGTLVGYFRSQGVGDPEALASETLMRLARSVGGFAGSYEQFRSWVFTVAHNLLIDERRKQSRRLTEVSPNSTAELVGGDVEQETIEHLANDWVAEALGILTDDQREVIALRILEGFTIGQTADITEKRPGAVKAAQRRGLRRIADWYARHPYPEGHEERSHE